MPYFKSCSPVSKLGSGTQATVSKPTDTADGDLLVAQIVLGSGGSPATGGWNVLITATDKRTLRQSTFWKIASSEPDSYSFSWSGSCASLAAICVYSGPWDAETMEGVTLPIVSSGTTVYTGADYFNYSPPHLAIAFFSIVASSPLTVQPDATQRYSDTIDNIAFASGDAEYTEGTLSPDKHATSPTSGRWIGHQALFNPA